MGYSDLPTRLAAVRERVSAACSRSGRHPEDVTIVAVTKTHPAAAVRAAVDAGLLDIGENRVQELDAKVAEIGREGARWHLIGHLQRNKTRRALELADLIHSIDSLRLAHKVSEEATAAERVAHVLVQVNVSGEETKGGLEGPSTLDEIGRIASLPGLRVLGLMTMAPFTEDLPLIRSVFTRARELSERAKSSFEGFEGRHLSMGMSGDYEVAIEEGSTLIRLGTVLLGERGR